ncbi:hypothetical protein G6O69_30805 [Pseudenhygromyxa sp. WMMC2535]|uniref:hypothetical protein n=1 Tax=Pseudenhygromyxa sp. WMMC2535 TaxID=2712867 RepID=UPI0015518A41|nr:hypothetical protein [Pseudenhygromyxa sp. WMMC2535]NVB42254.1 hypothetical protein [Pseudenhygromyxa sp. WMMC2535]
MRRILLALLFVTLTGLTALSHGFVRLDRDAFPRDADVYYLPPPQHLEAMSLGYREALADLIWIRAVIFTGERTGATNYAWIIEYLEAIYSLAPRFRKPYAWGGVVFIYSGEAINYEMVDRAVTLYRRGVEAFPEDHELLFALGMLLTRDVQTTPGYDEAEREQAMEEGVALIRKSAAFGAPPLVRQLAATLVSEGGADQLNIQFLEQQLLQAEDEDHRRLLKIKLQALIGEAGFEAIEKTRAQFEATHRAEYPYIPPDLFALIEEH